jgi:hypothetical protein
MKEKFIFPSMQCTVSSLTLKDIVTYRPIARQRVDKHILSVANALKNRTSVARQRSSKYASIREAAFFAWSVQSGYKDVFSSSNDVSCRVEKNGLEFEAPSWRKMSLEMN